MRPRDNSCSSITQSFNRPLLPDTGDQWAHQRKRLLSIYVLLGIMGAIAGCTTVTHSPPRALDLTATYVLLPIVNHTETPLAGRRVEDITAALLHSRGLVALRRYPPTFIQEASPLSTDDHLREEVKNWAKEQGIRYGVTGSVDEWRYKVGIDGEPAVGVNLQLVDLKTDHVLWSAVGAKSGWSREALSGVAQTLLDELLSELEWR